MTHYLISITPFDENMEPMDRTVIECESRFTLDVDLVEWVKEEIDPKAESIILGRDEEL